MYLERMIGELETVANCVDGRAITGGLNGAITIWDLDAPSILTKTEENYDEPVFAISVSPNKQIVVARRFSLVQILSATSLSELKSIVVAEETCPSVSFTCDSSWVLFTNSADTDATGAALACDSNEVWAVNVRPSVPAQALPIIKADTMIMGITASSFKPEFTVATKDRFIRTWEFSPNDTAKLIGETYVPAMPTSIAAFGSDDTLIGCKDGRIYSVKRGDSAAVPLEFLSDVWVESFSVCEKSGLLAVGLPDGTIAMYSLSGDHRIESSVRCRKSAVRRISLCVDGRRVLARYRMLRFAVIKL